MKWFIYLLLVVPLSLGAQEYFELTPTGFVSATDQKKSFVVLEVPELKQEDIYNRTLHYLHKIYKSPKDVISSVESTVITINGIQPKGIRRNKMHVFDMNYTISIDFKDGKIKMDSPSFKLTAYVTQPQELLLVSGNSLDGSTLGIYSPQLKLKSKLAKSDLETFFNTFLSSLRDSLVQAKTDDW